MHDSSDRVRGGGCSDRPIEPGDSAPLLRLEDGAGAWVSPRDDLHAGRPAVLVFARLPEASESLATLLGLLRRDEDSLLFVAARPQPPSETQADAAIWLRDRDGSAAEAYGFSAAPLATAACDANGRLLLLQSGPPAAQAQAVSAALDELARPFCLDGIAQHPPVLVLPRLLSRRDCESLMAEWDKPARLWPSDGFTSEGYEKEQVSFKLRVESHGDLVQLVLRDPPLERWLDARFARRLRREIHKVFQVRAPMREDYRIVCYDARHGGYLGPHRDNPTPQTRHRLFTAVVALNDAGDYAGGELRFPEYAVAGYRVAQGTAIVWSTSLLHEVRPVAAGRRFVLGTHLGI